MSDMVFLMLLFEHIVICVSLSSSIFFDAITEKNKKDPILKNVTAKNLKLFLAKTESGWLSYDEDLVNKLLLNRVDTSNTVTATIVDEEREKFDLLLSEKKGCLNVLFICATKYGDNLQEAFGPAKSVIYTEAMQSTEKKATTQYIHEVILLDLTTPQNRAAFFGLAWDDTLQTRLENVIHKAGGGNTAE
eukprot:jgi/Phyca11/15224/fgenesh1_pg.PHYCAscaffold_12_\